MLTFQFFPKVFSPYYGLSGRPQRTNEPINFNETLNKSGVELWTYVSKFTLLSCATDGVSVDAKLFRNGGWRRADQVKKFRVSYITINYKA